MSTIDANKKRFMYEYDKAAEESDEIRKKLDPTNTIRRTEDKYYVHPRDINVPDYEPKLPIDDYPISDKDKIRWKEQVPYTNRRIGDMDNDLDIQEKIEDEEKKRKFMDKYKLLKSLLSHGKKIE